MSPVCWQAAVTNISQPTYFVWLLSFNDTSIYLPTIEKHSTKAVEKKLVGQ